MPSLRTILTAFAVAAILSSSAAAPAAAMTTQQERDWGRGIAAQIVSQQGVLEDPLLTNWVNSIGHTLTGHAARPDINYTFTIINSEEVNAFSIPGGYVFVDAGLLNFVHSDDELAAVLGHEMGHVERRHVVSLSQTVKVLEVVLQAAGIFVPSVGRFGNLAGNLLLTKISRVDELQADQYGLMLMSQAGYDPDGMVAFLKRLETIHPEHRSLFGRYFETHPALGDRVKHLAGYPQLDRPATSAVLAEAIHDEDTGRYYTARQKINRVLATEPDNVLARSYDRKLSTIFAPVAAARPTSMDAQRARADSAVKDAQAGADAVKARLTLAKHDLDEYEKYLEQLGYYLDLEYRQGISHGSRLDRILSGQARIGQYLDHSDDQISQSIAQVEDLAAGDVKLAKDLRQRMDHPDPAAPIDAARMNLLIARAQAAHRQLVQAVDAARGAMAVGWEQGKTIKRFFDAFDEVSNYKGGDMQRADYRKLHAPLHTALLAAKKVAQAADIPARLLNNAQSLETMDRIDMVAPDGPARSTSYAAVLSHRFGVGASGVAQAAEILSSPSEVAAASIIAAEQRLPLPDVARGLAASGQQAPDYAASTGVRPETLQLELGLVWLSYANADLP